MGWETRNGRGRYYTRSLWQDGRVVRQYIGRGEKGERAEREDASRRDLQLQARELAQEMAREEREYQVAIDEPLDELEAVCKAAMTVAMERAGYHKPKRWVWRKRNGLQKRG
ncbi:MAG: hypothetical protein QGI09_03600 [Dehalococcoidia bacterium]|jgi:hypothetical protein|nr:hypothetical protein [Dehalococcoidia bacterium]